MLIGIRPKLVQNRTRRFLLERLGASRARIHYVQVGANDGRLDDPVFETARHHGWCGLLIEPNPAYFRSLQSLHEGNAGITLANVGISSSAGRARLFHLKPGAEANYPAWARGCASLDRARIVETLNAVSPDAESDVEATEVELCRLDALLDTHGIVRTDLLVVDVEGHEAEVLKSVDLASLKPDLVLIESNAGTSAEADPVRHAMTAHGYTPRRIGDDLVAFGPSYPMIAPTELLDLIGFD